MSQSDDASDPDGQMRSVDAQSLIERFGQIAIWKQGGKRAPHKPLLLLLALARVQRGVGRLIPYSDVDVKLGQLLRDYGPAVKQVETKLPFWNLRRDGLWDVPQHERLLGALGNRKRRKDIPRPILLKHGAEGGFHQPIYDFLRDHPDVVETLVALLLDQHFPDTYHTSILNSIGMPAATSEQRPFYQRRRRRRDPAFRAMIMRIYEYRCAVCGYDGRMDNGSFNLEAAHIKWHAAGGPDRAENGILLCSFHHNALDRGALGLDEQYTILVSQHVHGGAVVEQWLLRFVGRAINMPQSGHPTPAHAFTSWHHEQVFRKPARV